MTPLSLISKLATSNSNPQHVNQQVIGLERIDDEVFCSCESLERITIPLKDEIITEAETFQGCVNLNGVDLVEGELHKSIAALQLEEWRNDVSEEIDCINQILPNADAGHVNPLNYDGAAGNKARNIRRWIRSVLDKIDHYQAEHQRILNEAATILDATTLRLVLSQDGFVMDNILSFLELPSFELAEEGDDEEDSNEDEEMDEDYVGGVKTIATTMIMDWLKGETMLMILSKNDVDGGGVHLMQGGVIDLTRESSNDDVDGGAHQLMQGQGQGMIDGKSCLL